MEETEAQTKIGDIDYCEMYHLNQFLIPVLH